MSENCTAVRFSGYSMHYSDTYDKVRKKLPRAEAGSNVETTASETEEVGRRKRYDDIRLLKTQFLHGELLAAHLISLLG